MTTHHFIRSCSLALIAICSLLIVAPSWAEATKAASPSAQRFVKHPDDKSQSRYFVLDNELKVYLVSDPKFNKSSASLEVHVGSLEDPRERQGLAHFLEHMLFLGTKKYPKVGEYGEYLKRQGGYSNAFTGEDRTNYHFEVNHDALEGALDRFAQFFIAPLFDDQYIEREQNAVHSEHKKNLENDNWRYYQLRRSFYNPDHPANHFSTGDLDTLKGITRDEFVNFFNKYYSANLMSLSVLSSLSLDAQEKMVREKFAAIKNQKTKPLRYDPNFLKPSDGVRVVRMETLKDLRRMTLMFPLPSWMDHYKENPLGLIGHCVGHEGKGSLLSYLKAQGLATGLSAGGWMPTVDYGSFSISVELTPQGLAKYQEVIKACFSYLKLLRDAGVPEHALGEAQRLAELDYTYDDKGEGTSRAIHLTGNMNRYPLELVETIDFIFENIDHKLNQTYLDKLVPENMLCLIQAKNFGDIKADKTEKYYGTKYSHETIKGEFLAALKSPAAIAALALPAPNPFLPKTVDLLPEQPVKLIDEPGTALYYAQDVTFKRPKVAMRFQLRLPESFVNQRNASILDLYSDVISEQLNELAYPASEAGLNFSLDNGLSTISISVGGYDSSAQTLLTAVLDNMTKVTLSEERFAMLKDRRLRALHNFKREPAWRVGRMIARKMRKQVYWVPDENIPVVEAITLADVKAVATTLVGKIGLEGLIHGNVTADQAKTYFNLVRSRFQKEALPSNTWFYNGVLSQPDPEHLTYVSQLPTNNSSFWRTLWLGKDSAKTRAASRVLNNFLRQPFYHEMRTKQQLGYIVWGVTSSDRDQHYIMFIIQSESHTADKVRERVEAFSATLPAMWDQLPPEAFAKIKAAVKQQLLEKEKTIGEKAARFFNDAFFQFGEFDRTEQELAALETLDKATVQTMLVNALDPSTRKAMDILLYAQQHKIPDGIKVDVKDFDAFNKGRKFEVKRK